MGFLPAGGGGGYLTSCKTSEVSKFADERFALLVEAGLPVRWMRVASLIGFDAYMALAGAFAVTAKAQAERRINLPSLNAFLLQEEGPFQHGLFGSTAQDTRAAELAQCCVHQIWRQLLRLIGFDKLLALLGILAEGDQWRVSAPPGVAVYVRARVALRKHIQAELVASGAAGVHLAREMARQICKRVLSEKGRKAK